MQSFDVFLNHRGPDVKKTLASYLYRLLHSYELRVFLDFEDSLQQGDYFTSQIEVAIQNNLCTCAHFLYWIC